MRVLARSTLNDFVENCVGSSKRPALRAQLAAWFEQVKAADWKSSADLKAQFGSASILSAERVVFNIKGNDYRLIASVNYGHGILFVKWLGTHKEYDEIDAREINYDEARYSR